MGEIKNLNDFVEAVPEEKPKVAEIHLNDYPGELPASGRLLFTFQHPSPSQLFHAAKAGKKLSARYVEMPDELGVMCATMGLAHVSPPAEKPSLLYANLATKNGELFMWLMGKFLKEYPDLQDLEAKIDEAKKQSLMGM